MRAVIGLEQSSGGMVSHSIRLALVYQPGLVSEHGADNVFNRVFPTGNCVKGGQQPLSRETAYPIKVVRAVPVRRTRDVVEHLSYESAKRLLVP